MTVNDLIGPIPAELANLTKLEKLILGDGWRDSDGLNGPIPAWLGNLTQLKVLQLGGNRLNGPIPAELGNLIRLEVLDLGGNRLNGPIPAELGNLTRLEVLDLGGNQLNGPIPAELGNLIRLEVLDLGSYRLLDGSYRWPPSINQLDGVIPVALGNLTNLELLNLSNNVLSGSIPAVLWELTELVELDLSGNTLSGTIPVELGSLSRLQRLDLSSNELSGPIPAVLRLPNLLLVNLRNNQWSGPLPGAAAELANLEMLHSGRGRLRDTEQVGIERFTGESGQLVVLTAGSHGSDTWFRLWSPAGEELASTYVYGRGREFELAWLPSDGEYRIEVNPRPGVSDYEVDVRAVPVEPLTVGSPIDPFLAEGLGVRAWRFRGTAGHVVNVDARTGLGVWRFRGTAGHVINVDARTRLAMGSVAPKLVLLSSNDGERLGSGSSDYYYTWSLNGAVLPRTEDYVLVYAYPNKYDTLRVRVVVRASAPE